MYKTVPSLQKYSYWAKITAVFYGHCIRCQLFRACPLQRDTQINGVLFIQQSVCEQHRGDFTQEADLVCGICGAHGGYETAEVRDVRRDGGRRGLCRGPGKRVDGVFLDDLRAFGINADQWTTAAQDEGEWRRTAEREAGHFMAKWILAEKTKAGLRHAVVCPNVTGRTKTRIAQSSGLVLVRSPLLTSHKWRELVSSGRFVCRCHPFALVLRCLFCFASFSSLCFH